MIDIRRMMENDLVFAAERTAEAGWLSESLLETAGMYAHHPDGCFIAEQAGRPVGMCFSIPYGSFAFLGQIIVMEAMRGQGIGRQLVEHTLAHLDDMEIHSVFLDGVVPALSLYQRAGFTKQCRSLRFSGKVAGKAHPAVSPMQSGDMGAVCALDVDTFGGDRSYFLRRRYHFYPSLCKVAKVGGRVEGFIMGHIGHKVISVGPWVVSANMETPEALLHALALEAPLLPIALGCLETNQRSTALLRSLGLQERASPSWRMVYGEDVQVGKVEQNFAIGSPAKG